MSTSTTSALSNTALKVSSNIVLPTTTMGSTTLPKPIPTMVEIAERLVAVEKAVPTIVEISQRLVAVEKAVADMKGSSSETNNESVDTSMFMGGASMMDDIKNIFGMDSTSTVSVAPPINADASDEKEIAEETPVKSESTSAPSPALPPAAPTITAPKLQTTMEALAASKKGGGRFSQRAPNKISRRNIRMARSRSRRANRKGRKGTRRAERKQNARKQNARKQNA